MKKFMPKPHAIEKATTVLSSLVALYGCKQMTTLSDALIAQTLIVAQLEGTSLNMRDVATQTGIPYTSVSRILYALSIEEGGFVQLIPSKIDRRKKFLAVDFAALKRVLNPEAIGC